MVNQVKHIPKDAQVIMSILKELGVSDYEPRVINQLLEFTYRKCEGWINKVEHKLIPSRYRICDLYFG